MNKHNNTHELVISRLEKQLQWTRLKFLAVSILLFFFTMYGGSMIIMIPVELWRTGKLSSNISSTEYIVLAMVVIFYYPLYKKVIKIVNDVLNLDKRIQNLISDR